MPAGRPAIPAQTERDVLIEAGHRCAIPTCRAHPVEIAHIEPWSEVQNHEFANLIALCPTCHARQERGEIDRKAMRQYKANLGIINARYGEYERRLLEFFALRRRVDVKKYRIAEDRGGVAALIEHFVSLDPTKADETRAAAGWWLNNDMPLAALLPGGQEFLLTRLIIDGYLVKLPTQEVGVVLNGNVLGLPLVEAYVVTEAGKELVDRLIAAEPLDP